MMPHDARPPHKASFPLLITSRLRPGLPSLRHASEAARIRAAIAASNLAARASASELLPARGSPGERRPSRSVPPFQVVHHTIQSNHLHLIVEATGRAALSSGMRCLLIRIARALNRLWRRAGGVFADRFHERELRNPRQVRNALVYVLQNLRKHGICVEGPDPLSSGPEFGGWRIAGGVVRCAGPRGAPAPQGGSLQARTNAFLRAARIEVPKPSTWLLSTGWMRHGLIDPSEFPRSGRR